MIRRKQEQGKVVEKCEKERGSLTGLKRARETGVVGRAVLCVGVCVCVERE